MQEVCFFEMSKLNVVCSHGIVNDMISKQEIHLQKIRGHGASRHYSSSYILVCICPCRDRVGG